MTRHHARWFAAVLLLLLGPTAAAGSATGAPQPRHAVSARDGWSWPLDPVPSVTRPFDPPDSAWGSGHRGVDLSGSVGQLVRAVADGRVSFAGSVAGRGVVVVDHGLLRSTYEPVVPLVRRGDAVSRGVPIATLTSVRSHCVPVVCLHLGAREGDAYVDPLSLLDGGTIRLKPLEGQSTESGPGTAQTWTRAPSPAASPASPTVREPVRSGAGVGLTVGGA